MPTYEYECEHCGHRFEEFQRITDPPIKKCPKCKKNGQVHRLISAGVGFIFKGSGFYATDYRSENYKKGAKEEKNKTTPASKSTTATSILEKKTSLKDKS